MSDSQTGDRLFGLGDLACWLRDGDRAALAPASQRGHVFSTVTMSSLPGGSPPMEPGGLFIAIRGARRDGHDFVADAFANGAKAALVARVPDILCADVERGAVEVWHGRPSAGGDLSAGKPLLIVVDDPMRALQRCATWWRKAHAARVIAITGSVGKTTTKDLLAAILEQKGSLLRTRGNYNNELGLPFTLLQLTPAHRHAVLEIGISAVGEMDVFAGIAAPDTGIVTRVAPAHLEQFGDVETVEQEKGRLVEALRPDGIAILNADDPRVRRMSGRTRAHVLTFGEGPDAAVRAEALESIGFDGIRFRLVYEGESRDVTVPLVGKHFVTCALAAAAAAFTEECTWEQIVAGLGQRPMGRRVEPISLPSGVTLLDDTYNASPAAMNAALDVLAVCPGRRIAVLGDMFEMGAAGPVAHRTVGAYVPGHADLLVAVGELGGEIARGACEAGMLEDRVQSFPSNEEAVAYLEARLSAGDFVLVKGSRGMRMDRIVSALAGEHAPAITGGH